MTKRVSVSIAKWLEKNRVINSDEIDVYTYAAFNILHTATPLLFTIVIGILMNLVLESILVIVPFVLLRKYTGGYHATTPLRCALLSAVLLSLLLAIIKATMAFSLWLSCLLIVSETILFIFSPVDPQKRHLDAYEKRLCFVRSKQILIILDIVIVTLVCNQKQVASISISFGVILCALAQIPVIILNFRKRVM